MQSIPVCVRARLYICHHGREGGGGEKSTGSSHVTATVLQDLLLVTRRSANQAQLRSLARDLNLVCVCARTHSAESRRERQGRQASRQDMTGYTYYPPLCAGCALSQASYFPPKQAPGADFYYQFVLPQPPPHLDMFSQIARINDHLYLSGLQALSPERLRQYGITQIVSAMVDPIPSALLSVVDTHVQVSVEDIDYSNLRVHFDTVADRIAREARRGGRTLVHCMAGVSRSATLVLAYLIKHQKMSLSQAYDLVRSKRPCIQPNLGFWRQLIAYEEARRGVRSMKIASDATSNLNFSPASSSRYTAWNYLATTPPRQKNRYRWTSRVEDF